MILGPISTQFLSTATQFQSSLSLVCVAAASVIAAIVTYIHDGTTLPLPCTKTLPHSIYL